MTSVSRPRPSGAAAALTGFRLPWKPLLLTVAISALILIGSTAAHLAVLPATGSLPVGRDRVVLVDDDRPELHTADRDDLRLVPLLLWYPAEPGTGTPARYVEDLELIGDALVDSGSLSRVEVAGLRWVRTGSLEGADIADRSLPVIVLSPGNQTNVGFYASLAEELASHGYLVIGVDHAFQVAATVTAEGAVAGYDTAMDTGDPTSSIAVKLEERVADLLFVLDALRSGADELSEFHSVADLDRIGFLGHSNGGLAAVEVCRVDPSVDACLNMDGQGGGGPLGHSPDAVAPSVPFLFLTKETFLHENIADRFEQAPSSAVRAVVPDAEHDSFTDGPMLRPGFNPLTTSAQRVMTSIRSVTLAFFDNWLAQQRDRPYDGLVSPADLYISVYPLGEAEPIPEAGRP